MTNKQPELYCIICREESGRCFLAGNVYRGRSKMIDINYGTNWLESYYALDIKRQLGSNRIAEKYSFIPAPNGDDITALPEKDAIAIANFELDEERVERWKAKEKRPAVLDALANPQREGRVRVVSIYGNYDRNGNEIPPRDFSIAQHIYQQKLASKKE